MYTVEIIMKRAAVFQMGSYTFLLIILAFILIFGYRVITSTTQQQDVVALTLFKTQLENDFKEIQFGDVRIEKYRVPTGVDAVCFIEPINTGLCAASCPSNGTYPAVENAWRDESSENVFFMQGQIPDASRMDGFTLECCPYNCFNVTRGRLTLRLQKEVDKAVILET